MRLLDLRQQVGEAAFDRFHLADARVGGIQPLDEHRDAVVKNMPLGHEAAGLLGVLNLLDLVGQRLHQRFQPWRRGIAVLRLLGERLAERVDTMLEAGERVGIGAGLGDMVDLVGERLHLRGQGAHGVAGGHAVGHVAQGGDGAFELRHRRRIPLGDDQIDLLRKPRYRVVEADEFLGRGQSAQRVTHFRQAVLNG